MHLLKLNLKHLFQLKNVRERLAKNLTEKGVLTTEKQVSRNPRFASRNNGPFVNRSSMSKENKSLILLYCLPLKPQHLVRILDPTLYLNSEKNLSILYT